MTGARPAFDVALETDEIAMRRSGMLKRHDEAARMNAHASEEHHRARV
jgi:hypothetical protein